MEVIAQLVRTEWTKQSRGGTGAARRNAVPTAFLLPSVHPPLTHTVVMDERDDFEPAESLEYALPDKTIVRLKEADGKLRVQLEAASGLPQRKHRPPAIWLARGEWMQWQINYRFSGYSTEWIYRFDTLNIAYGDAKPDTFTTGLPNRHVDERARLF
ncbi:MAG: hypothetical protein FWE35_05545 [Streptosporangiales bacterium]|nr:hypothetical protein [Streptosporangiales bacterium]